MAADGAIGDDWLDLADAIELLRAQLGEAQRRGGESDIRFGIGEITVEVGLELTRSRSRGGGLRFAVAGVEANKGAVRGATHRVTLTLRPRLPGGEEVEVADEEQA